MLRKQQWFCDDVEELVKGGPHANAVFQMDEARWKS